MKTLRGHKGDVHCALLTSSSSLSPSPDLLFTSGYDQTIRLWNPTSGQALGSFQGHNSIIKALSFCIYSSIASHLLPTSASPSLAKSESVAFLLSGSWDHTVRIWNIQTQQCQHSLLGHHNRVKSVISFVLYDLIYILSGSDDCRILFWSYDPNRNHSELLISYEGHQQSILSLALSNTSYQHKYLASGSADQTIRIWELNYSPNSTTSISSSKLTLTGHRGGVNCVVFSILDDTKQLFSCSDDASIIIWDYESGYIMRQLYGHQSGITSITTLFRDDNEYILSVSHDATLRIWNSKTTKELKKIECHTTRVSLLSISLLEDISGTKVAISGTDGYLRLIPRLEDLYLGTAMSGIGLRVDSHSPEAVSFISKVQFIPKTRVLKNLVVGGFDYSNSFSYEQSPDTSNLLPKITSQKNMQGGRPLKSSDVGKFGRIGKKKSGGSTDVSEMNLGSPIESSPLISHLMSPISVRSHPNDKTSKSGSSPKDSPSKPSRIRPQLKAFHETDESIQIPSPLIDDEIDLDESSCVQLQLPQANTSSSSPTLLSPSTLSSSYHQLQRIGNDGRAYLKSAGSISPSSTPFHNPPVYHTHRRITPKIASTHHKSTTTTRLPQCPRKKEFILTVSMYSEPTPVSDGNHMLRVLSYNAATAGVMKPEAR